MRYKLCRCGAVVKDHKGFFCAKCGAGKKAQTTTQRGYDGQWNRLSQRLRAERPLCEVCLVHGMVKPSTEVHHKLSIEAAPHLRLEPNNLMCLCNDCHKAIHAGRSADVAPGVG